MKLPDILCPGHHSRYCHLVTVSRRLPLNVNPGAIRVASPASHAWTRIYFSGYRAAHSGAGDERRAGEKGSPKGGDVGGERPAGGLRVGRRGAGVLAVCRCCVIRERRRQRRGVGRG